ncbi:hypothetical protein [uncultured Anaerovibrio sp.]|uniref:hypothetical protein n=1 Tax=uncultured Anaerovibrio sp. TaxID=361586 RepID=UPI00262F15CF|nr:hypothetical protein [uncultured Anaerovibrio sp.]
MAFEELDYKSEKILKYFKKHVLLNSTWDDYDGFLCILLKAGYIQNKDIHHCKYKTLYQDGTYEITTLGRIYFDLRFKSRLYGISRSLIAPIVVSLITNLVVILLKG